jgi:hypothetical protein
VHVKESVAVKGHQADIVVDSWAQNAHVIQKNI